MAGNQAINLRFLMERKTIIKTILSIAVLILLAGFLVYYFVWKEINRPVIFPGPTPSGIATIEDKTISCLGKILIEGDPHIGILSQTDLLGGAISDFYYSAYIKSASGVKIEGCDMIKITLIQDKKNPVAEYYFYLPNDLFSMMDNKKVLPSQLAFLVGEKAEFLIRYRFSEDKKTPVGILGWEMKKIMYTDADNTQGIQDFYNAIKENK